MSRSNRRRRETKYSAANQRLPPSSDLIPRKSTTDYLSAVRKQLSRPWSSETTKDRTHNYAHRDLPRKQPTRTSVQSKTNKPIFNYLPKLQNPSWVLSMAEPVRRPMVCETRQMRKEVLHAQNKTGKVGQKKPVFTELSKIKCKRR